MAKLTSWWRLSSILPDQIVIAAPKSDGGTYKTYWAAREEDMESYLLSPASGSFFIECFRRDGTEETKALAWYRSRRKFELKTL